jgi:hypothetical protein
MGKVIEVEPVDELTITLYGREALLENRRTLKRRPPPERDEQETEQKGRRT